MIRLRTFSLPVAATLLGLFPPGAEAQTPREAPVVDRPITRLAPTAPLAPAASVAAAPAITTLQSPNGLFKLNITDDGIELRGPAGGVKISDAGIEIGAPNGSRVTLSATGMELWGEKTLRLNARESVEAVNGPGGNIVRLSPAGMELTGLGPVQLKAGGAVEITGGKGPGVSTVRLSDTGMQVKGGGTVELQGGGGSTRVRLTASGVALNGAAITLNAPGPCLPVARVNDQVTGVIGGAGGPGAPLISGKVAAGSASVLAC